MDPDVVGFVTGKRAKGTFEILVEGPGIRPLEFLASDRCRFHSRGNEAPNVILLMVVGIQLPIIVNVGNLVRVNDAFLRRGVGLGVKNF